MFEAEEIDFEVEIKQENVDSEGNVLECYPESVVIEKTEPTDSISSDPALATQDTEANEGVRVKTEPEATTSSGFERPMVVNFNNSFHNFVCREASYLMQCFKCKSKHPPSLTQLVIDDSDMGRKYLCQKCVQAFKECLSVRDGSLVYSYVSHHSCYICKARFGGKRDLDTHLAIAHKKTPQTVHKALKFQCPLCIRAYNDRSYLIKHLKVHTNKTVRCFKCASTDSVSLVSDSTSTNKYLCKKCSDAFKEGGEPVYLNCLSTRLNPEQYVCDICKKYYKNKYFLNKHIDLVHKKVLELSYENQCFKCREKHSPSDTQIVIDDSDNKRKRICKKCLNAFKECLLVKDFSLVFLNRISSEQGSSQYSCDICRQGFNKRQYLLKHINHMHNKTVKCFKCRSNPYLSDAQLITDASDNKTKHLCQKCLDKFKNYLSVRDTSLVFLNGYFCDICDDLYVNETLKKHMARAHPELRKRVKFPCSVCNSAYSSQSYLKKHMEKHRKKERKSFACDRCDAVFATERNLTSHIMWSHEREILTFPCSHCERTFNSTSCLKRHLKLSHEPSEQVTFPCNLCRNVLSSKKMLFLHAKAVHPKRDVKRFSCKICNKVFLEHHNLKFHLSVAHTVIKKTKLRCWICARFFPGLDALKSHIRLVHGNRRK